MEAVVKYRTVHVCKDCSFVTFDTYKALRHESETGHRISRYEFIGTKPLREYARPAKPQGKRVGGEHLKTVYVCRDCGFATFDFHKAHGHVRSHEHRIARYEFLKGKLVDRKEWKRPTIPKGW